METNVFLTPTPPLSGAKPSGRKGSRKVRTGCVTCKIRKVKCDEAKPFCLRCVKTGRKCDGYGPTRHHSSSSSPSPSPSSSSASSTSLTASPSLLEFESPASIHAFDFYRTRTASLLGGSTDTNFWGGLVLRLSVTEPAVQHAVLALSSLHEAVNSRKVGVAGHVQNQVARTFTFSEYGKAMTALRKWDSKRNPVAIPLLVCVLFTCIEFMLEHDNTSQLHICQGRHILSKLENSRSPIVDMIRRELVPVYARLSLSSFLFGSQPAAIPAHMRTITAVPTEFSSLSEARELLYLLFDEALRFTLQGRPAVYAPDTDPDEMARLLDIQQRHLVQLTQWRNSFSILTTKLPPNQASLATQSVLQIFHHAAIIWISTALEPLELAFDAHTSAFASIISLASSVVSSNSSSLKTSCFTFETELIAPLYWAAIKCRHPLLRRSALRLLMRDELKDRKENLWYAREAIVVASRVIELEEGTDSMDWLFEERFPSTSPAVSSNGTILSEGHSDITSIASYADDLVIPTSHPPTLAPRKTISLEPSPDDPPHPLLSIEDEDFNNVSHTIQPSFTPPSSVLEIVPSSAAAVSGCSVPEPPYGIPEARRIKNAVIGPRSAGGIFATMFKDPQDGQTQWNITRELLRL